MKNKFLVLILQNLALFPYQEIKLELNNEESKKIIEKAAANFNGELLIVSPNENVEEIDLNDLPKLGIEGKIKKSLSLPNGNLRIVLRGVKRVRIKTYNFDDFNMIEAQSSLIENPPYNMEEELAYTRKLKNLITEYVNAGGNESNSIINIIKNVTTVSKLTDMIAAFLDLSYRDKCELLNETNYYTRAKKLISILTNAITSLELERRIDEEVRDNFEKSERDIIIKEKIRALNNELGNDNEKERLCSNFLKTIEALDIDEKIKEDMIGEVKKLEMTLDTSPELEMIRSHLEFITDLPWNKSTKDNTNIKDVDRKLNETHYGLNDAKARIEEYLILKKKNKNLHSPILCLIGPPGTGKTTFARELASSIGREFLKISVGGLNDSSELVGHRKTYIASGPGKIMAGIKRCGVNNPVILIDEVDKMVKDYKGDPASALLDILDQNQNKEFIDNYVSEPFDLSNVLFILTANDLNSIPPALLDRLEVIEVNSYTAFDKVQIVKNYTLPRMGAEYGFDYKKIKMSDNVILKIIRDYTNEAGARDLERHIASILRKILIKGLKNIVRVEEKDIPNYLGKNKYSNYINIYTKSGTVNVPACTKNGGTILNIECELFRGPSKIITTGSLEKVTTESIAVALSYLKSNYKEFKIDYKKFNNTLHVHLLDASSKKDGPSAGLGITAAILSLLLDKVVPTDIAFTGEITLKGRILRIGSLREKIISAYNGGIKKIYIPMENVGELELIPKKILKSINIVPVNSFTEVYNDIFN